MQDVFELQVSTQSQWPAFPGDVLPAGWMDGWMDYLHMDQRNLNNAFAYDLVPSPSVITAALRAARRVNDYPTAVRIFEGKEPPPLSKNTFPFRPPQPISPLPPIRL